MQPRGRRTCRTPCPFPPPARAKGNTQQLGVWLVAQRTQKQLHPTHNLRTPPDGKEGGFASFLAEPGPSLGKH